MDSLLLLCCAGPYLLYWSGMFMHKRACVCSRLHRLYPARSCYSADWGGYPQSFARMTQLDTQESCISVNNSNKGTCCPGSHICSDRKDGYGEAVKISGPNQAAQIEKD
ncbi:unnamed protein product [Heligmosomoides polygyrus]|uniref:Secreted protein n=1 Tax=Heligmosomoides polygyrus TaxID=6339 RepID=A0A183GPB1_HELPZ|nr:unnamed protein product [Heligmosomoides polygyrus]